MIELQRDLIAFILTHLGTITNVAVLSFHEIKKLCLFNRFRLAWGDWGVYQKYSNRQRKITKVTTLYKPRIKVLETINVSAVKVMLESSASQMDPNRNSSLACMFIPVDIGHADPTTYWGYTMSQAPCSMLHRHYLILPTNPRGDISPFSRSIPHLHGWLNDLWGNLGWLSTKGLTSRNEPEGSIKDKWRLA